MKELTQLQVLNFAKSALESKADALVARYGKDQGATKREIITAINSCFEHIDWIDSEIDRIRKNNPAPPPLKG